MNDFSIQYPWMLTLLIPFFIAVFVYWKRSDPSIQFPTLQVMKQLPQSSLRIPQTLPKIIYSFSAFLLIFALSEPRFGVGEIIQKSQGIDILIAVDLSGSMGAIDVPSHIKTVEELDNALMRDKTVLRRIDLSKKEIRQFIHSRPNDRIGLIAFAAQGYTSCPPTIDHDALLFRLDELELHTIGEGTGIASAIATAVNRLKKIDTRRKILVLFTDGENTVTNRVSPVQAAQIAKNHNIIIHTVGIGSQRAYELVTFFGQHRYEPYKDHFDEKLLRQISSITGGRYYVAEDAEGMKAALEDIDKIELKTFHIPKTVLYRNIAPEIALIVFLLIFFAYLSERTWWIRYP